MKIISILVLCIFATACSFPAPKYQPSAENSNLLQDVTKNKLSVKQFTQSDPELSNITLRGSSLVSPYEESYALYLTRALEEELKLAGLWSQDSNIDIAGKLLENDVDVSGFSTGVTTISAQFIVTRDNDVVYDQVLTETHEFESSFIGAIAIPAGQNNYHIGLQKLFAKLFSDQDFIGAIQ